MGGGMDQATLNLTRTIFINTSYICLTHLQSGDVAAAVKRLEQGRELLEFIEPERRARNFFDAMRGRVEDARQSHDRAIELYEGVLVSDPAWVRLKVLEGKSHLAAFRRDRTGSDPERLRLAEQAFEAALTRHPDRFEAAFFLGECARLRGDLESTRRWCALGVASSSCSRGIL